MRVYPWPNRHSASRGRWEDAEAGADNISFESVTNFHGFIVTFSLFFLSLDTYIPKVATKQVQKGCEVLPKKGGRMAS